MNLLITGAWTDRYIGEIEKMGHRAVFMKWENDELPCEYDWVEGTVCNGLFLRHPLSRFTNLQYIQLTSAGTDRVPLDEILKRKIEIHNARGVYSIPMAEYAVAGVLNLYKQMGQFHDRQKNRVWIKNRQIRELAGSRVLIVGCGSVGTECAKRFRAFGCKVIGVDIEETEDADYEQILPPDALDDELAAADVVILTLPLTDATRGLIDERRLNLVKGVLVNISRGAIVEQRALEKWDGASVLDVFEEEPLDPASPLWDKENTIITPHNSFIGDGNGSRLKELILSNLGTFHGYIRNQEDSGRKFRTEE